MKFELELENKKNETQLITCDIFAYWFDLGLDSIGQPEITHWNVFHKHDALERLYKVIPLLNKKVNEWNAIAEKYNTADVPLSNILGHTVMSNGQAFCTIENKLDKFKPLEEWYKLDAGKIDHRWGLIVHQDIINPMQTQCILVYRVLNDQGYIDNVKKLVDIFNTLKVLRDITTTITQETNLQNFGLKFNEDFHLLDDEWADRFSMERNPGEIFLYPTQIGYDYDNVMIEMYDDDKHNAIKMTSNSFDLLEQQVCYTGELLFWCGDPRTHEEALDHLNYSLMDYWGGYKIKKTDTRNKYDMLTWGMLKVGSFDIVPEPEFNTVRDYKIIEQEDTTEQEEELIDVVR